ncbi:MAG: c-type cytochrome biogenesis protein CcmI [bacterium]|nr:c-type cytochrome biogenesis protein CcmI [bacterium]
MLLWSIIIVLLVVTLAGLLLPLYRGEDTLASREAYDANIFKDQLKAIDRELDEGQLEQTDAQSARVEISRKLLAAADKAEQHPSIQTQSRQLSRYTALLLVLGVPLFAIGLYLQVGSPHQRDLPLEARAKVVPDNSKLVSLIARAEQRLEANPGDGNGWEIMAPIYLRYQMYGKAAAAYKNSIRLLGSNADRLSGLADAMVLANDNIVGDDVLPILKRAIKADPDHPKPQFWMGLYLEQNNKFKQAEEIFTSLLKKASEQVGWRPTVVVRLNEVREKQGLPPINIAGVQPTKQPAIKLGDARKQTVAPLKGPSADDIKAAGQMSAIDRKSKINNMVMRLSTRLREEGGDLKSWMQLVRVLNVQGKKAEARVAVQDAKKNLRDSNAAAQLDALAKKLQLGS